MRALAQTCGRADVLLQEVLRSAWLNRGRFLLSAFGIVVAVSMVLGMRTLVRGLESFIDEQFESFGTRKAYVARVPWGGDRSLEEYLRRPRLDAAVAAAVAADPQIAAAAPCARATTRLEIGGEALDGVEVVGAGPVYLDLEGYRLARGRSLVAADADRRSRVAVIGAEVARKLRDVGAPQEVELGGAVFRVVGSLESRGTMLGQSFDSSIYVPLPVFEAVFGTHHDLEVAALVAPGAGMEEALDELRARLRRVRRLAAADPDDFALNSSARLFEEYRRIARAASWVIYAVGLLVMLVSGLGISNVMLATLRERAYEIGVKKAVGATVPDIFFETLSEVLLMCLASGGAGILLGGAFCIFLRLVSPVAASLSPLDLGLSLLFPALTALLFGSVPAALATRVQPVRLLQG